MNHDYPKPRDRIGDWLSVVGLLVVIAMALLLSMAAVSVLSEMMAP